MFPLCHLHLNNVLGCSLTTQTNVCDWSWRRNREASNCVCVCVCVCACGCVWMCVWSWRCSREAASCVCVVVGACACLSVCVCTRCPSARPAMCPLGVHRLRTQDKRYHRRHNSEGSTLALAG